MQYLRLSRILRWINLLLVLFITLSILYFIRIFLTQKTISIKWDLPVKGDSSSGSPSLEDYAGLLKDNPFGIKGEFREITSTSGTEDNSSGIILVGTISGGDYNYAIVVDPSGKQEIFKKGQDLYGIGRLQAVYRDRIVLKTPSGKRTIEMADLIIKEIRPQVNTPPQRQVRAPAVETSRGSFVIDSEALRNALENPKEILTDARFIPNIVEGRQEGFIIRELKKGGIYESLGLEEGDILLRVNDMAITGPETALQTFTALKGMDRIQLDIIRRGQRISMTYQIR